MENKNVGWLVLGISALMIIIIVLFNSTLKDFVDSSCTLAHGDAAVCPMYTTINQQTYLAIAIVGILILFGLVLIFTKPQERVIVRKVMEKKPEKIFDTSHLTKEEKQVFGLVKDQGAVFQADLIEKTQFGKAKMSRIIDRLEGQGLVERKRRGMTNVVVLKED